ncbi:DUF1769 domain-containing protein [Aspergillus glaucus CBS 516.65]|uniref:Domain of unknown function at the cortex 1 domain-containing protein n=1 Tax=Aspergillus glaucus CBS 516.65 TaxID=1160497 RepID=A0A1L9VZJ7_ASPGL|nr:hypothetical protein ASPGLDRAFT_115370 [Aspergillus glaucus CBS 516.65]OJJ89350.1 hypothetical protein ASPGLDRAFT_115370 [Aspergillus glaucus CBS 516.65]
MASRSRSTSRSHLTPSRRRSSSASKSNTSATSGELFEQAQHKKYRLKVTAGTQYDPSTHQLVPVNGDETVRIDNDLATVSLAVRIQDYNGYPDTSPTTHPIFTHPSHTTDQYSLTFSIIFKKPVNGNALLFGHDFDRPIRDRLPPGFNTALRLVKWSIDPSMDGDAYADKPYLFSPALASWNQFRVGGKVKSGDEVPRVNGVVVQEGDEGGDAGEVRERCKVPAEAGERMKFFQGEEERKGFVFEEGRVYQVGFGNPYLVFNDFSLRLPGFTLHAIKYVDERNHDLRYVLKNRETGEVYFIILFTLVLVGTEQEKNHIKEAEEGTKETKEKDGSLGNIGWEA